MAKLAFDGAPQALDDVIAQVVRPGTGSLHDVRNAMAQV